MAPNLSGNSQGESTSPAPAQAKTPAATATTAAKPANTKRVLVIDTQDPSRTHFAGLRLEKGVSRREIPDDAWLEAEKARLAGYWNKLGYKMSVQEA